MLQNIKSFFKKLNTKYSDERRDNKMVRQIIQKQSDEDIVRSQMNEQVVPIREHDISETKDIEDQDKPKVYVQQVCLSTAQMFNVMNEKLDILTNAIGQLIETTSKK